MIQYQLQKDGKGNICAVSIVGSNVSIPISDANTDYQQYLAWLAEGNEPLPPDAPATE